jgi:ATP adenylyltransferase
MARGKMDQLWAPWRMPYILSSAPEPGCLFCLKFREDEDDQNHIVYRAERTFVMMNLYPYNPGHLMVIPYQHSGKLDELDPEVGAEIFTTAQLAVRALDQVMRPDGYNLGINQAKVAGAGVADHIHMHVVPRWTGDTNFMPVLADTKVIPELLGATAAKLRPEFAGRKSPE